MKVLMINVVCGIRSTGRICTDIATRLEAQGHEVKIAYGREDVPAQYQKYAVRIGTDLALQFNAIEARILDNEGFNAYHQTEKFLKWADNYNPDLIWLHNLHGYYINIDLLFRWIKSKSKIKCLWTLHDCWAFTGHCAYFSAIGCEKWMSRCEGCPQKREYPTSFFADCSAKNYEKKRITLTGVKDMTIYTPSQWLADLVSVSFLKEYPIEVRYNIVDDSMFFQRSSNFREERGLLNCKIILGVASTWDKRKGLFDFYKLAILLGDKYKVVLVGLNKRQLATAPSNVLCLPKTNSAKELAELYSVADCMVSLSKEETFGMTILEAYKCGTLSVVYKQTACEEVVNYIGKGRSVEQNIQAVKNAVQELCC